MYSLRLLNALNILRRRHHPLAQHPVYLRDETSRLIRERRKRRRNRIMAAIVIPLGLLGWRQATGALDPAQMLGCVGPILVMYTFMVLWTLPLGATISPALAEERTRGTWDLVRITPLEDTPLLLAKMRTRTHELADYFGGMLLMLILFAGVIGLWFAAAVLIAFGVAYEPQTRVLVVMCASVGGLIFFMDRLQQLLMMGVGAMTGGALNQSSRAASALGFLVALLLWVAEIVWTVGVLLITDVPEHGYLEEGILLAFTLGPMPAFVINFPLLWLVLLIVSTFVLREVVIRVLWRWALRAMRWR